MLTDNKKYKALVALEDGTLFYGWTCGHRGIVCGEIIFNTSMTGYQEICTDPSYAQQIVLFTTSHVGNVGVNREDNESCRTWVKGIIVREMSQVTSNWRSEKSFVAFLNENSIPWIEGLDTRKLTRHIRKNGTKNACIMTGEIDANLALELAKKHRSEKVTKEPITKLQFGPKYTLDSTASAFSQIPYPQLDRVDLQTTELTLLSSNFDTKASFAMVSNRFNHRIFSQEIGAPLILLYDFGVKSSIIRMLMPLGCEILIIPNHLSAEGALAYNPDGIILSNGPGNPAEIGVEVDEIRKIIFSCVPVLGICLGCQLIALAAGGKTKKLKFGHHGVNHPVYDLKKKKVYITSQNHDYVIDESCLPQELEVTHISLFDHSIQGIRSKNYPIIGFQGHPEGSPGPQDIKELFSDFLEEVNSRNAIRSSH